MTVEFKEGNYISRIWFFSKKGAAFDINATLWRKLPDGAWNFDYRFRYYNDDKAFDSKDRKSFYHGTFPEKLDEASVIRKLSPAIQNLKLATRLDVDCVIVETDDPYAIMDALSTHKKSWISFKIDEPITALGGKGTVGKT